MKPVLIPALPCGNFASVVKMVEHVGGKAELVDRPERLKDAERIILAGVGAFDHGMSAIRAGGWEEALGDAALVRKIPVMGICLGMQLLCKRSEEGTLPGLGWIDADVVRFQIPQGSTLKVPHMGWNEVRPARANPLVAASDPPARFYFVHSYHVVCRDAHDRAASCVHGIEFTAALHRGNILGAQFHPEKSHRFGMELFRNFLAFEPQSAAPAGTVAF